MSTVSQQTHVQSKKATARISHFFSVFGLVALLVFLIAIFSILKPDTFFTGFTFYSLANNRSIYALAALAVMIPLAANQYDLSVGSLIGISQILAIGLQANQGLPWWLVCVLVLAIGVIVGLINGLLVTVAGIGSFIATLGTGSILLGILQWYSGGQQIIGFIDPAFVAIAGRAWTGGPPSSLLYVIVIAIILWIALERRPFGRFLYVIGESPRMAELNGVSTKKYITLSFIVSGLVASFAGLILQAQLQVGQSTVGPEFMLPAFTGALLGATSIRPGRTNVGGTLLAISVIAVAVAGLNQMGAPFYVEALFNGFMLIISVGLTLAAARRRERLSTTR